MSYHTEGSGVKVLLDSNTKLFLGAEDLIVLSCLLQSITKKRPNVLNCVGKSKSWVWRRVGVEGNTSFENIHICILVYVYVYLCT